MTTAIKHHETHRHGHNNDTASHSARQREVAAEATSIIDRLTHSSIGEEAKVLVGKLRESVEMLKENASLAQEQIKSGVHATEKAIKQNPWASAATAVGLGLVIGYLLGRRGGRAE